MEKTIIKRKPRKKKKQTFLTKIKNRFQNVFSIKKKRKSRKPRNPVINNVYDSVICSILKNGLATINLGDNKMKKEMIKQKLCELVDLLCDDETSAPVAVAPAKVAEQSNILNLSDAPKETVETRATVELTDDEKTFVFTKDKRAAGKKEIEIFQKQWKLLGAENQDKFLAGKVDSLGNKIKKEKTAATAAVAPAAPAITKEEVKAAIVKVCETKGDAEGIAILTSFKASKISELKESDYAAVIEKAANALAPKTTSMLD